MSLISSLLFSSLLLLLFFFFSPSRHTNFLLLLLFFSLARFEKSVSSPVTILFLSFVLNISFSFLDDPIREKRGRPVGGGRRRLLLKARRAVVTLVLQRKLSKWISVRLCQLSLNSFRLCAHISISWCVQSLSGGLSGPVGRISNDRTMQTIFLFLPLAVAGQQREKDGRK